MTVPTWYNDNHYISEKVDECNTIKFGAVEGEEFTPWTAASVRDFMAAANGETSYAAWMGYDNFVTNGNAENVSPNPLFDVMQYVYAKAAQLNAMNDGAGYGVNANNWTGQLVLDFFKANNISAWDHFTTAGQFEDVNPSNAMDLSAFLTAKAAQCNELQFDDKSDWTPEAVLDYYRANGLNAVEVANSANDPLVTPVPAENAVTVPTNLNPWGTDGGLNVVNLTSTDHVYNDEGIPTNFVGTVDSSASKSTFNNVDQITGTNDQDVLSVAMNADFRGMDKGGFVKGVPTVDLTDTAGKDVTFNARGIEDVTTWNADGNINIVDLAAPGVTVNLENVNSTKGIQIGFAADSVTNTDDSLTIGLENVFVPGRVNSQTGTDQPNTEVAIKAAGIENVTLNSTGINENMVNLNDVTFMQDLTITGDGDLQATAQSTHLQTIDGKDATGDLTINHGSYALKSVATGSGNDVINTWNIAATASVDGGAGSDTLNIVGGSGQYDLNMNNVETLQISSNNNIVTIEGDSVEGMENLKLANDSNDVILGHFTQSQLNVQATQDNTAGLVIADIGAINMRVGDGNKYYEDSFTGYVKLGSATDLTINADDGIDADSPESTFNAPVYAENLQALTMQAAKGSHVIIAGDSDLQDLSSVTVNGYGEFVLGSKNAKVGVDSAAITVDTSAVNGNSTFKGEFLNNNTNGGATLTVNGGTLGDNYIVADSTFARVSMNAGMGDDTLVLDAGNGKVWSKGAISGDLGTQTGDELVVEGLPFVTDLATGVTTYSDFSALQGVDKIVFTDPRMVNCPFSADDPTEGIILPSGMTAANVVYDPQYLINEAGSTPAEGTDPGTIYNDTFNMDIASDQVGDVIMGGNGGKDSYVGVVDSEDVNLTMIASNAEGTRGAVSVDFGPDSQNQLDIQAVKNLTITGDGMPSSITGTVGNIVEDFTLTTGPARDIVNLHMVSAGENVTINGNNKGNLIVAQTTGDNNPALGKQTTDTGVQIGGIDAGNAAIVNATANVTNVLLGDIAASQVLLGATLTNGVVTDSALANTGEINVGNISEAKDGVTINVDDTTEGAVEIGTISASATTGNRTVTGDVDIDVNNLEDATFAGILAGNNAAVNSDNAGALAFTQGINVDGNIDVTAGNDAGISLGNLDAGNTEGAGTVTVAANNGTATSNASATIGTIVSHDGDVTLTAADTVSTFNVGTITAGDGDVSVILNNSGATTLAGITTTGDATIDATDATGATTLQAGNIGKLDYDGNDKVDTVTASVGNSSDISTGDGSDVINLTAVNDAANSNATVTIAVDGGVGTDRITLTGNAGADKVAQFNVTDSDVTIADTYIINTPTSGLSYTKITATSTTSLGNIQMADVIDGGSNGTAVSGTQLATIQAALTAVNASNASDAANGVTWYNDNLFAINSKVDSLFAMNEAGTSVVEITATGIFNTAAADFGWTIA